MVDVRLKGGLGNQLFQFATSHALSKKLNCELKVDICFYKVQLFRSLDINQVDIQLKILPRSECISLGAPLNFRNKAIRKFGLTSKTFPSNLEEIQPFIYDSRIELLEGPVYLDGYWQNLNYFEDYNNELRSLLTPGGEFSCAYYDYLDQIINSESVSLHIRRGDYVNDPHTKSINYVCDSDYYLKAVKFIKERVNNPNFFYLF